MSVNNNDDPNFERRLIMAFALSVLLFLIVLPFLNKKRLPEAAPAHPPAAATTTAPKSAPAPVPPAASAAAPAAPAAQSAPAPTIAAASEQQVTINTPVYHVVLSNHGASARAWVLTQYKDDN